MSQKELTSLAKQIYGSSDKRVKELQSMYHATQIEIAGIISNFISDDDNWNVQAPKQLKMQLMDELKQMYKSADNADQSLIAVTMANHALSTIGDAVKISASIALLELAHKRRVQLANTLEAIPQQVRSVGYDKASRQTDKHFKKINGRLPNPAEHEYELARRYPAKYHKVLAQNSVSKMVQKFGSGIDTNEAINRNTVAMMNKVNELVDRIDTRHIKPQEYSRDLVKIFTGSNSPNRGAVYNAERLLRTESAYTFANSLKDDFKKRKVKYFTNVSIRGRNTCKFCERMDSKTFKVSDMQPGVNCAPFHPNCQCDIIEATKEDIENMNL